MSNVSIAHTVTKFDAKNSQALTGQRLAKCRYKTTVKQSAKFPSVCVSVPYIDTTTIDATAMMLLKPHIQAMLENAQDGIIRSLYESSDGALSQVTDSDLSISACIAFMNAENEGSRLTKEFIESWFDSSVRDYVYALVSEKLGYGTDDLTMEQDLTVCKHVNGYRGMYSALAGGKTMYQPNQIASLKRVLDIVDTDDTQVKLLSRLNKMLETPKIEDLLEL